MELYLKVRCAHFQDGLSGRRIAQGFGISRDSVAKMLAYSEVRAGPAGLSIGALGARSGVTGSTLTHHMKILPSAGLVSQTRQGRSIICAAVAYDQLHNLADFLVNACCADASKAEKSHDHG